MQATDACIKFKCNHVCLVRQGPYWCCPVCGASYGAEAKGWAILWSGHVR
jgi:hypothetical protein